MSSVVVTKVFDCRRSPGSSIDGTSILARGGGLTGLAERIGGE